MKKQHFLVEKERFSLADKNVYFVEGYLPENIEVEARLNKKTLPVTIEKNSSGEVRQYYKPGEIRQGKRMRVCVTLPDPLPEKGSLVLKAGLIDAPRTEWFKISARRLAAKQKEPQYFLEEGGYSPDGKTLVIRGWAVDTKPVDVFLYDDGHCRTDIELERGERCDVAEIYDEYEVTPRNGFYTEIKSPKGRYLYLVMRGDKGRTAVCPIGIGKPEILLQKLQQNARKSMEYMQRNGLVELVVKVRQKYELRKNMAPKYTDWLAEHLPGDEELKRQRNRVFSEKAPKISVVVPLYRTPKDFLEQMIQSVQEQSYSNWELCLSDGSGADSPIRDILDDYAAKDPRIKVIHNEEALRIAQNTNAAIKEATGDFIAFLDHDDLLTPDALYHVASVVEQHPDTKIIYTDEDKKLQETGRFCDPHFKPDYNQDLLWSVNYFCHLFVAEKALLDRVGLLRPEFDGAQDYDLILRCTENTDKIRHIPRILYHWRSHEDSTAENPESKMYAFDAGRRALQAHFDRLGIPARVVCTEQPGVYHTQYLWKEKPLVSIIIPNKDHRKDLEKCIFSIEGKSSWENREYIIVENNSTDEETFAYYESLKTKVRNLKIVTWDGPFNYSAINNFGVTFAKGEYLLFLNNDTEVITSEWIEEMAGYCMRPDVGAVGARLYYSDNTIQHAGVVLGFGGVAGHCFVQQPRTSKGYFARIITAQNYSAVTAACMMVRRDVFEKVGGFSPELAVAFNDVDFCLKVQKEGYRVVYNPYVELYHYESKSRGQEDTPEKMERFRAEIKTIEKKWPGIFTEPDPYYNPNLTLYSQDFSLKRSFEK